MAYNGSGTFLINTAGQPVVPNTVISATAFNALTNDLANGLSTCITKDGQTTPTANIPMGNNKITGLAPGTSGTDAANLSQVQGSTAKLLQSVTGTDTITAAMVPALTSYAAGQMFYFVAAGDNTGAVTINIDSLGAKSVTRDGSTALVAGDIVSGEVALIVYDGTRFQLLNGNSFTNLNVSNNLTLSGGTANGVLYLNGSKIVTSGSGLVFDSSGNLGLGVTPSAWGSGSTAFQLGNGAIWKSGSRSVDWITNGYYNGTNYIYNASAAATYYRQFDGVHSWYTAPSGTAGNAITFTQAMTLTAGGSLGIGTTSPSYSLVVSANGAQGLEFDATAVGSAPIIQAYNRSGSAYIQLTYSALQHVWQTSGTERGRFTAGGYFKASNDGTYVSSTGSYHEFRTNAADWTVRTSSTTSTAANCYGIYVKYSNAAPNNTGNDFLYCEDNAVTRFALRSNGGLANYQTNDVNLSDERVKTDIAPLGSMWGKIKALEIVTFKYKDQTHDDDNIGLIAQQVEAVAPEFVDVDGWGETPEDGVPLKSIYTADMYHAAIKALQEAMARIESLEAKVAALEAQ